jgi:hypothetical protein
MLLKLIIVFLYSAWIAGFWALCNLSKLLHCLVLSSAANSATLSKVMQSIRAQLSVESLQARRRYIRNSAGHISSSATRVSWMHSLSRLKLVLLELCVISGSAAHWRLPRWCREDHCFSASRSDRGGAASDFVSWRHRAGTGTIYSEPGRGLYGPFAATPTSQYSTQTRATRRCFSTPRTTTRKSGPRHIGDWTDTLTPYNVRPLFSSRSHHFLRSSNSCGHKVLSHPGCTGSLRSTTKESFCGTIWAPWGPPPIAWLNILPACLEHTLAILHITWGTAGCLDQEMGLETATHKPLCWFRYVDDTFVIWPHGPGKLAEFLNHLNGVHENINFTMERDGRLPFLDIDIYRKHDGSLGHKRTHTNLYLHANSHQHPSNQKAVLSTLVHRARAVWSRKAPW